MGCSALTIHSSRLRLAARLNSGVSRQGGVMAIASTEIWDEWRRLTRFIECSRIAFQRELNTWSGLEVPNLSDVRISTQNGVSQFSVSVSDHLQALRDDDLLWFVVLTYSYSICERHARMKLGIAQTDHISGGIESWGGKVLDNANKTWADVLGGRAGIIEVAVARNFLAHGSRVVDTAVLNRFSSSGETSPWPLGASVTLTYDTVETYRSRLKSLMRLAGK